MFRHPALAYCVGVSPNLSSLSCNLPNYVNTENAVVLTSFTCFWPPHLFSCSRICQLNSRCWCYNEQPQYFLQLVPTVYRLSSGATVHSNQYSATEHLKHVHAGEPSYFVLRL